MQSFVYSATGKNDVPLNLIKTYLFIYKGFPNLNQCTLRWYWTPPSGVLPIELIKSSIILYFFFFPKFGT